MAALAPVGRLSPHGLLAPAAEFTARLGGVRAAWERKHTVVEKLRLRRGRAFGSARQLRAWRAVTGTGGRTLALPPALAPALVRAGMLARIEPDPSAQEPREIDPDRLQPAPGTPPLFGYQAAAVADAHARFASCPGFGRYYMKMLPGLGKTRTAIEIIAAEASPALVVVPCQLIADQWLEELGKLYPRLVVAQYRNQARRPAGPDTHDVAVVVVNTAREKPPEFFAGYGLIVLDEAHEYISPRNVEVLWLAQAPAVLGLSGSPDDRYDLLDRYVFEHLGQPVDAESLNPELLQEGARAEFRVEVREVRWRGGAGFTDTVESARGTASAIGTISQFCEDPARLRLVAEEAARLYWLHTTLGPEELARHGLGPRPGAASTPDYPAGGLRRHGVLVLAEHREYLPALLAELRKLVNERELEAPELTMLRGGATADDLVAARSAGAHIVVATYGYFRRGGNLVELTALVKATPRRTGHRQINGRILRRGSDASIVRQIVDIVDVATALKSQATDRRGYYRDRGWPISVVTAEAPPAEAATAPATRPETPPDDADAVADLLDELSRMG